MIFCAFLLDDNWRSLIFACLLFAECSILIDDEGFFYFFSSSSSHIDLRAAYGSSWKWWLWLEPNRMKLERIAIFSIFIASTTDKNPRQNVNGTHKSGARQMAVCVKMCVATPWHIPKQRGARFQNENQFSDLYLCTFNHGRLTYRHTTIVHLLGFLAPDYKPHVARMHHASLLTSRVSLSHATPKTLWIAPGIKSGKVLSIEAIDLAFVFFTARQLYLLHSLWRFFCADFRASQCERFDFIILELHPFFCYLWFPRLQFWNALFGMVRCYVFAVGGIFLLLKSAQFHGFYVMPFSNLKGKRYNFFTYN